MKAKRETVIEKYGAPGEIRTPDLLIRSQPLYPTELRAHTTLDFSRKPFRKLRPADAPLLYGRGSDWGLRSFGNYGIDEAADALHLYGDFVSRL